MQPVERRGRLMCTDMKNLQDTLINETNMVESRILKEGGVYTQKLVSTKYFWRDIQKNSNSVPSEVDL